MNSVLSLALAPQVTECDPRSGSGSEEPWRNRQLGLGDSGKTSWGGWVTDRPEMGKGSSSQWEGTSHRERPEALDGAWLRRRKDGMEENKVRFAESLQRLVGRRAQTGLMGGTSFPCVSQEVCRAELGQGRVEGRGGQEAGEEAGVWAPGLSQVRPHPCSISLRFLLAMCSECSSENDGKSAQLGGKPFQVQASAHVCKARILSPCKLE